MDNRELKSLIDKELLNVEETAAIEFLLGCNKFMKIENTSNAISNSTTTTTIVHTNALTTNNFIARQQKNNTVKINKIIRSKEETDAAKERRRERKRVLAHEARRKKEHKVSQLSNSMKMLTAQFDVLRQVNSALVNAMKRTIDVLHHHGKNIDEEIGLAIQDYGHHNQVDISKESSMLLSSSDLRRSSSGSTDISEDSIILDTKNTTDHMTSCSHAYTTMENNTDMI